MDARKLLLEDDDEEAQRKREEAQRKRRRPKKLIPNKRVCERYGVCEMTIHRWERDPKLGFPRGYKIRERKYQDEDELDAFDERQRVAGADA